MNEVRFFVSCIFPFSVCSPRNNNAICLLLDNSVMVLRGIIRYWYGCLRRRISAFMKYRAF
jgi:hypothetical protein